MATTYKTPGVYIEEISKFPPSIAQVETAIPAFIGYTEFAKSKPSVETDDLILKPKRITSLLDYTTYFGMAQNERGITVKLKDALVDGSENRTINVPEPAVKSPYLMYYSLQMYFANGGGPCYIVSTGAYEDWTDSETPPGIDFADLNGGLGVVRKEDEPTLIVFPDATNLGVDSDFYSLYNNALMQCKDLQDRFTIIDTFSDREYNNGSEDLEPLAALRNGINLNKDYLKYGATYFPFIQTILNYQYSGDDIVIEHLSYNPNAIATVQENLDAISAPTALPVQIEALRDLSGANVTGKIREVLFFMHDDTDGFDIDGTFATNSVKVNDFSALVISMLTNLNNVIDTKEQVNKEAHAAIASSEENSAIQTAISDALDVFNTDFEGTDKIIAVTKNLEDLQVKLNQADTSTKVENILHINTLNFLEELQKLLAYDLSTETSASVITDLFSDIETNLGNIIAEVNTAEPIDVNNGKLNGRLLSDIEPLDNATYNTILSEINNHRVALPPGATMAGIYARVDNDRGVWKAPANTGLNYVIRPTVTISHEEQAGMNVHTTGKSVNAIRAFIGKGTLVWGARTLAGNDNEWRYVPVRRFFNMVEESTKKATEQFVFEPNDANTWVKVRAMIENFLTLQWRAGALAGAKPEQAFYVRVGLGQTMTALDILEGRMNIEIGMAVVRPAEFIILKFSHKMQES
ncbi:phage tail sheath family protein [Sinomicrobium sp. M5D2P17]